MHYHSANLQKIEPVFYVLDGVILIGLILLKFRYWPMWEAHLGGRCISLFWHQMSIVGYNKDRIEKTGDSRMVGWEEGTVKRSFPFPTPVRFFFLHDESSAFVTKIVFFSVFQKKSRRNLVFSYKLIEIWKSYALIRV